jgi:hypothetical protein
MSGDLLRWARLFWIAGPSAALLGLCLWSAPSGAAAQLYGLLSLTVQAATAGIGPAETKIRRKLLVVAAALPLKSP